MSDGDNGLEQGTRPRSRRSAPRPMAAITAGVEATPMAPGWPDDPKIPFEFGEAAEEPWDARAAREHRELYAELAPRRRERARIPERFVGLEWTESEFEFDERAGAIRAAMAWAEGTGPRGLLLHGPVGRGKTRVAATAAWHRCAIGPVVWRNVAELLMALSYSFDHPERERALSDLRGLGDAALVLDDLDKTKPTDHALQPLYLAVNAWVEAQRPLIVTMNRPVDELARDLGDRFGAPIASRLAGYCQEFEVGGRDRRLEP